MLKERAYDYYENKDCNCAEAVIRAANDEYDLGINEQGLRSFGGFGAGMYCGSVCGAISGALGAISAREIKTCAHQTQALGPKCKAMMNGFKERFGSAFCTKVKADHGHPERRCGDVVMGAAEILEEIMK